MSGRGSRTLLHQLAAQRHWQVYETFEQQFRRAAEGLAREEGEDRLRFASVSRRQMERWFGGSIKGTPRPAQCRVLELMFGRSIDELLSEPAVSGSAGCSRVATSAGASSRQVDSVDQLAAAARRARDFTAEHERTIGSETMQQLFSDVRDLARSYPRQPLSSILDELTTTQEFVFSLLDERARPTDARTLYFFATVLTGMLAKASHDFGDRRSAMAQARAAMVCAENADHDGLRAWIFGMESLVSFWAGAHEDAISYARRGWDVVGNSAGTVKVWLPALEARAHACLGNAAATEESIRRAEAARDGCELDDLDELGGVLTFSLARQLYYSAEADVLVRQSSPGARDRAFEAVAAYRDARPDEWAFADDAGARSALALAHVRAGDSAAAHEALKPVFELDPGSRINGIVRSLARVQGELNDRRLGSASESSSLRQHLEEFAPTRLRSLTR